MNEKRITRISADDIGKLAPGQTDWKRVRDTTDEEIEAAIRDDPDWADFADVDWSKAVIVVPKKKQAISIRLDEDVVDFFKAQGEGYQTRINAVLRHYMDSTKKPDAAE
jgi:uncharacterized protein (DUF4415 family)